MAHNHGFAFRLVILKTPQGYLTESGFTQDVTSHEILTVRAGLLGGMWAPKHFRLKKFKEIFSVDIAFNEEECEFFTYSSSDESRNNLSKWY